MGAAWCIISYLWLDQDSVDAGEKNHSSHAFLSEFHAIAVRTPVEEETATLINTRRYLPLDMPYRVWKLHGALIGMLCCILHLDQGTRHRVCQLRCHKKHFEILMQCILCPQTMAIVEVGSLPPHYCCFPFEPFDQ